MSSQDEPENTHADDAPASDETDDAAPPSEDERIEQLTERIDKARTRAEDDKTIAPPG